MLPYHWEHCGIIIPFQTTKYSDTQIFTNQSKTQRGNPLVARPTTRSSGIA